MEITYESVVLVMRMHSVFTGELVIALDCQPFSVAEDQGFRQIKETGDTHCEAKIGILDQYRHLKLDNG